MRKVARFIPALLLALVPFVAFGGTAFGSDEDASFIRFQDKGTRGSLDIATATYRSEKTNVEVVLYGVVHIADPAYYKKVQKELNSMDVVLFEGVKPPKDATPDESMKGLGEMQGMMGDLLGLQFQKDGIDYTQKNLVHADMTMDELKAASGGDMSKALPMLKMFDPKMMKQLGPMMQMFKTFGKTLMKSNPAMRNNLKMMMARQMGNADMGALPGGEEMTRVILIERNKVAIKVLDEQLKKHDSGKIAIFYGAAHMPDMEKRLAERGFKQTSKTWHAAWTIGGDEDEGDDDDDDRAPARKHAEPEKKQPALPAGKRWL